MLSFEAYRLRMETGLSFIEFNYQLLQSYDFWELYRRYGCRLQIGGDDQWGNIVAGMELIRRMEGKPPEKAGTEEAGGVFGLTFPLVTASDGRKMGKTEKGAVFLDPALTSPYDFFQYWRNAHDADIKRFLLMFTFLPVRECNDLCAAGPNVAKERLAWEVTALIHGKDEADRALSGARAAFAAGEGGADRSLIPSKAFPAARFEAGVNVIDLFTECGLCGTKSEARRLALQGGAFISSADGVFTPVSDVKTMITTAGFSGGELLLRAGKKHFCRIVFEEPV
jgi:tyrosyl-tRNA synthetase